MGDFDACSWLGTHCLRAAELPGGLVTADSWAGPPRVYEFMSQESRVGPGSFSSTKLSDDADAADQGRTLENHHSGEQQGPILLETRSPAKHLLFLLTIAAQAALPLPTSHSPFLPSNRNPIVLEGAMVSTKRTPFTSSP